MRYRYDHRVAIAGLVLGAFVLAAGLLTGQREAAGALTMATVITSTLVAYVRVPDRRR
jgi:uncharacterized membrane protein (UPF0136 family)